MASCPNCESTDLVRIDLRPHDGFYRFSSCRTCEHKWWTRPAEEAAVRLPEVIAAVATTGRAR